MRFRDECMNDVVDSGLVRGKMHPKELSRVFRVGVGVFVGRSSLNRIAEFDDDDL